METARVDIRKLQLLNDRINQCLDALNQVRLSVHGLSHTTSPVTGGIGAQIPSQIPMAGSMTGIGAGQDPRLAFGVNPFTQPQLGFYGGLSHTPFAQQVPQGLGFFPGTAQLPYWGGAGLSHTGAEVESSYGRPIWTDPVLAVKVKETFPFVSYALPPVVALY